MRSNYQYTVTPPPNPPYQHIFREDRKQKQRRNNIYNENLHPNNSHYNSRHDNSIPDSIDILHHEHQQNAYDNDEITLLRQALIEKHHKLLKELEVKNSLQAKLEHLQATAIKLQRENALLLDKVDDLEFQKDKQFKSIELRGQQRLKDLQSQLFQQTHRNSELKKDLETMRNKMLENIVIQNNLQQRNTELLVQEKRLILQIKQKNDIIREKQSQIDYFGKELDVHRKKIEKEQYERKHLQDQLHRVNRTLLDKNSVQAELQSLLRNQKDKNAKILQQIMSIQAEHKGTLHKLAQLEDQCNEYKDKVYWLESNREKNKFQNDQMEKLTQQLNSMTAMYKQKEKQLQYYKKKPTQDAQKKKKNYEHTKDFVHKLESQQAQYEHTLRNNGKKKDYLRSEVYNHNQRTNSPLNRSSMNFSKCRQNPLQSTTPNRSHSRSPNPITHQGYENQNDKGKYLSLMNDVQELQTSLLQCNMEKKKILAQMDRIDATRVKTRDMVLKRRKLDEDLAYQEDKSSKVKEKLRKIKVL